MGGWVVEKTEEEQVVDFFVFLAGSVLSSFLFSLPSPSSWVGGWVGGWDLPSDERIVDFFVFLAGSVLSSFLSLFLLPPFAFFGTENT